ncbi:MAG: hypothetical protein ACFFCM_18945 [Promethearchaeota archaeon]
MINRKLYNQKIRNLTRHKKGRYSNLECENLAIWLSDTINKFSRNDNLCCVDVPFLAYLHHWLLKHGWDVGLDFICKFRDLKRKYKQDIKNK